MQFSKHLAKSTRRFGISLIGAVSLASTMGFGLLASSSAMAQAYPNKPIRLVVTLSIVLFTRPPQEKCRRFSFASIDRGADSAFFAILHEFRGEDSNPYIRDQNPLSCH